MPELKADFRVLTRNGKARMSIIDQCNECRQPDDDFLVGQVGYIVKQHLEGLIEVLRADFAKGARVVFADCYSGFGDVGAPGGVINNPVFTSNKESR